MNVPVDLIKQLRVKTGLGMVECKTALEQTNNNLEAALDYLRKKGIKISEKKAARETRQGTIGSYIHTNGKIGVLIEVNCESDFVARTDDFKELVKNLTLQITAANPSWIDRESVPADIIEKQKAAFAEMYKDKPEAVREKIAIGKLEDFYKEMVLLDQLYIRDDKFTIKDCLTEKIAKLGENIRIKRFVRYELGE